MSNPVADQSLVQWQSDISTSDSNRPITATDYMNQGSPEDLAANQRVWRSTFRSEGVNKGWERWLNLNNPSSPNPAPPAYASANSFTLTGDWTTATAFYPAITVIGRRIKATVAAGTVYGTITAASFAGASTLVTCAMDLGEALDSGLSEVQFGVLASALPGNVVTQNSASLYTTITNGGAGSAFTGALTPAITAYQAGKIYAFLWTQASQGGDTVALNGLAAIPVKYWVNGALVALAAGTIPAGAIGIFIYDGTNFDLQTVFGMAPVTPPANFAKATLGTALQIGAVGGTVGYNTWATVLSVTLPVQNLADLFEIFATAVLYVVNQGPSDIYEFRITDAASNILSDVNENQTNNAGLTVSYRTSGVELGTPITPGATGSQTFNLQVLIANNSSNATFALSIQTMRLWVKEYT